MNKINYKVIPHLEQRYKTCGDYWLDEDGVYQVRVSKLSKPQYEFLILFHELFEIRWALDNGIKIEDIDAFDIEYEENRKEGDVREPGDDPRAPYYMGHQAATALERTAATFLGVDWKTYSDEVESL